MNELSKMRCVVFGGGGFVGTNLCRSLVGKVDTLRIFGRRKSFPNAINGINWIPGDFTDSASVASAVAGCDTVFHLVTATTPASSNIDKIADIESNVVSTLHLLEACRDQGVRRVIFVSSGGTVYGTPDIIPTPETAPVNPITAYGISKLSIEKYLYLYKHLYGIEYKVLRVANPFGPFQTALRNQGVIAAFLLRAIEKKPIEIWGDGSIIRDYVYIDDVVNALELAAIHKGKSHVFNIGSGIGRSLSEIVNSLAGILGYPIDTRYFESRKADVPKSVLNIDLAQTELDWRPKVDFLDGLVRTANWIKEANSSNSAN